VLTIHFRHIIAVDVETYANARSFSSALASESQNLANISKAEREQPFWRAVTLTIDKNRIRIERNYASDVLNPNFLVNQDAPKIDASAFWHVTQAAIVPLNILFLYNAQ